LHRPHSQ